MVKKLGTYFAAFLVAARAISSALAQENTVAPQTRDLENPPPFGEVGTDLGVYSGYDAASRTHFNGSHYNDSDVFNLDIRTSAHIPVGSNCFLQLGWLLDNNYFEQVTGAPVPQQMHTLRLNTGFGHEINDQWAVTALFSPSIYRFDEFGSQDIGFEFGALASYRPTRNLAVVFGILGSPDSNLPVLPIGGVRWRIDDRWLLEAGLPKTRLSYFIQRKWSVYGGAEMHGTIFRGPEDMGDKIGQPAYNDALGVYRDIRVGFGTSYEMIKGLRAEIESGYSVYRDIYYTRIDQDVRFGASPYVRAAVSFRF